jgi:hypothetical protein
MHLNGCHNRKPFKRMVSLSATYTLVVSSEGVHHHVIAEAVQEWPFVFTRECVYTKSELGQADKGGIGCNWRQDAKGETGKRIKSEGNTPQ